MLLGSPGLHPERPVTLLQRLKAETAVAHERIELAFDLEGRTRSAAAYRDLLARLHGFHARWEPHLEAVLGDADFVRRRRKIHLLVADLRALGMTHGDIAALPRCPLVPMRTPAEVLGSMYVMEGSTLGGTIIARHVERSLGLSRETGCSYFRCYGDEVGPMWKAFGATLLAECGPSDDLAVIGSAKRTFDVLHRWLCLRQDDPLESAPMPLTCV